jgi:hypothetical protein
MPDRGTFGLVCVSRRSATFPKGQYPKLGRRLCARSHLHCDRWGCRVRGRLVAPLYERTQSELGPEWSAVTQPALSPEARFLALSARSRSRPWRAAKGRDPKSKLRHHRARIGGLNAPNDSPKKDGQAKAKLNVVCSLTSSTGSTFTARRLPTGREEDSRLSCVGLAPKLWCLTQVPKTLQKKAPKTLIFLDSESN